MLFFFEKHEYAACIISLLRAKDFLLFTFSVDVNSREDISQNLLLGGRFAPYVKHSIFVIITQTKMHVYITCFSFLSTKMPRAFSRRFAQMNI